ncbi:uncharacterized protein TNIN_474021 [Trichonephila inaurata madagascariensis]|uniref:Uncharacterized protein n=1 Tax=Trichonephila inaurata madagascariensis TaxID=2747483 RepID=A0A8X6YHS7_9ARAC|nr:uncharacterized protein TNIN_257751 [Trichonephila inaurata madagascariensis]GFY70817.1 uncharacterized protein TNIN_474021 [Trichonephila inaurata madagascariensis]
MNIRFFPSLQLLATVRIALRFIHEFHFHIVRTDFKGVTGDRERFYNVSIRHKVRLIHLPNLIRKNISGIVRAMATEVAKWYDSHRDLLPPASIDNWKRICWYSHGTIDYFATARAFLQDENLNRRQRFVLSCKYYLEDDVEALWEDMSEDDLMFIKRHTEWTSDLRFWMDALQSNTTLDWTQITHEAETGNYYRTNYPSNFFCGNYLGLPYYFPRLRSVRARFRCLYLATGNYSIRPFYLYLCLAQMQDYEVDGMFKRFPEKHRYQVIESFLYWPLQGIFLSIIERFRHRISNEIYLDLFKFILCERFERELLDHQYVSLVKQLWAPLSEETRSFVRKDRLYPCIAYIINSSDQDPIPNNLIELFKCR